MLSQQIKLLMQEHRLNHTEFAERVGVDRRSVAKWICNSATPSYHNIASIIDQFEVSPSFFFNQSSKM